MEDNEKDIAIQKEINRLWKAFSDLDGNKKIVVRRLVKTAAYLSVTMDELEEEINQNGLTEEYLNGENQTGYKRTAAIITYEAMTRNLNSIMKQLTELVPAEKKKKSRLQELRDE